MFLFHIFFILNSLGNVQNQYEMADFQIFNENDYTVSVSYNLIEKFTGKSLSTLEDCAHKCLSSQLCQTATYYVRTRRCLLYRERFGLGQLVTVPSQTAAVISLINQSPRGRGTTLFHISMLLFI